MRAVRPNLALLWPSYTFFPLIGLGILAMGVAVSDGIMVVIGIVMLAFIAGTLMNYAYFTQLAIEGDDLVHHSLFGTHHIPIASLQRIDAKRYPGGHEGVSAPFLVARGRSATVKVNSKPYRLAELGRLIAAIRAVNAHVELDPFWDHVVRGEDVSKEITLTPLSRW